MDDPAVRTLLRQAIADAAALSPLRVLSRRVLLRRLFFRLRAEGVGYLRARRMTRQVVAAARHVRRAEGAQRDEAVALALDTLLAG